jgi:hypothetical protein
MYKQNQLNEISPCQPIIKVLRISASSIFIERRVPSMPYFQHSQRTKASSMFYETDTGRTIRFQITRLVSSVYNQLKKPLNAYDLPQKAVLAIN